MIIVEILVSIYFISSLFHEFKLDKLGAIILELILALTSLYIINHVRKNLRKRNWNQISNGVLTYSIRGNPNYTTMETITFDYNYRVSLRNIAKKFHVNIRKEKIEDAEKILNQKINSEHYKPLIYTDPRNGRKSTFQNEFTITNIMILPIVLITQLFLLIYADYLDFLGYTGSKTFQQESFVNMYQNISFIFQNLQGTLEYYFMIVNILLILIYLIYLVYGISTHGMKGFRNYPLFYHEGNDTIINLINELTHMSQLCDQCGEIIEKNDLFCAYCGKSVSINS